MKAEGLGVMDNPMVGIYSDEEVLFEGLQTLPLFLVNTTQYGSSGGGEQDQVTTGPKGWDFLNQSIGAGDKVGADDETATPKDEIIWQQQKENKELKKDIEGMRRANEQLQKENEDLKKENEVIKRVSEQLQQEIDDLKKAQIGGKGKAEVWI